MNSENKISVIVPVFNLMNVLPRCINSIINQTYSDLEIVIVDDGSTDGSWNVIQNLKDERIIKIHQENGGVTSARINGLNHATGDYIGFVDGDDEIEPEMYEILLRNALQYGADISHCGYQMVFSDGRVSYFYNTGCIEEYDRVTALKELLSGQKIEPGLCNKLFKKNLIDLFMKNITMPNEIRINEDLLMNYYLFSKADISVFQDFCPYHYIVRQNSASRVRMNNHKIFDPVKVKEIVLNDCGPELKEAAQQALVTTCVYTYCVLSLDSGYTNEKNEIRNKLKNYRSVTLKSSKVSILKNLIIYLPWLFKIIYPVYSNKFQINRYK